MPRGPRINHPGLIYHVMFRGYNRMRIFRDDEDRKDLLRRLNEIAKESKAKVYAWLLMSNHVHFLVRTSDKASLSRIFQRVKGGYAQYFNHKYGRSGTPFDGRFKSTVVDEEGYLLHLVRYIYLNPYRAGMVKDLRELLSYRWSGHTAMLTRKRQPFHAVKEIQDRFRGRKDYLQFLADGMKQAPEDLDGGGLIRSLGGVGRALQRLKEGVKEKYDSRILGSGEFVGKIWELLEEKGEQKPRVSLEELIGRMCDHCKTDIRKIIYWRKQKGTAKTKSLIVSVAERALNIPGVELARRLKVTSSRISQLKYAGEKLLEEPVFAKAMLALAS